MGTTLKIRDLAQVSELESDDLSAIRGGIAERFLFMSGGGGGAPVINQFFEGVFNINYQDDRDVINASEGAKVVNVGGNSNTTAQTQSNFMSNFQSAISGRVEDEISKALG